MNFISFHVHKSLHTFVPILQMTKLRLGLGNVSKSTTRKEILKQV